MNRTRITINPSMKYLFLSRVLDNEARENGYGNCPDDIMNLILNLTGDINEYSTCFYKVTIDYRYKYKLSDRIVENKIEQYNRNHNNSTMSNDEYRKLIHNPYSKVRTSTKTLNYCGCCNRFYISTKSHITRDIHLRNFHNQGDRLTNPDYIKSLKKQNNSRWEYYHTEILSVSNPVFKEIFNEKPIPPPPPPVVRKKRIKKLKGG